MVSKDNNVDDWDSCSSQFLRSVPRDHPSSNPRGDNLSAGSRIQFVACNVYEGNVELAAAIASVACVPGAAALHAGAVEQETGRLMAPTAAGGPPRFLVLQRKEI